jgi:hypothetical protein
MQTSIRRTGHGKRALPWSHGRASREGADHAGQLAVIADRPPAKTRSRLTAIPTHLRTPVCWPGASFGLRFVTFGKRSKPFLPWSVGVSAPQGGSLCARPRLCRGPVANSRQHPGSRHLPATATSCPACPPPASIAHLSPRATLSRRYQSRQGRKGAGHPVSSEASAARVSRRVLYSKPVRQCVSAYNFAPLRRGIGVQFRPPDVLSDRSLLISERRGDEAGGYNRAGAASLFRSGLLQYPYVHSEYLVARIV